MKLIYIYHSGYVIDTGQYSILIDYYKDTGEGLYQGFIHDDLLRRPETLYILSSHFHPDHFNPEILKWKERKDNIRYIFSRDILKHKRAKEEDAFYLMKGEEYVDENITVKAFGSTDVGVSFLIQSGGKRIFHAGDLNNWHWKDESTPQEVAQAEKQYLRELGLLQKSADSVDITMFPVDPHLGTDYMLGAEQFIDQIKTGLFVPMHFGEAYAKANAFREYAEKHHTRFATWTERGQSLEF